MTCHKVRYPTKAAALTDIKQININRKWRSKRLGVSPKSGRKMRAYLCRWCSQWHLTSQKQRKK